MNEETNQHSDETELAQDVASDSRREALKRLGILGAYTAPAMLMLLNSRASAQAVSSGSTT